MITNCKQPSLLSQIVSYPTLWSRARISYCLTHKDYTRVKVVAYVKRSSLIYLKCKLQSKIVYNSFRAEKVIASLVFAITLTNNLRSLFKSKCLNSKNILYKKVLTTFVIRHSCLRRS
jgi:hypothetical protein